LSVVSESGSRDFREGRRRVSLAELISLCKTAVGNVLLKRLNKTYGNPLAATKIPQAFEKYANSGDGTQQNGIHRNSTGLKEVQQIHYSQLPGKMTWCGTKAKPGPRARSMK